MGRYNILAVTGSPGVLSSPASRFATGPTYAHRIIDALRRFAAKPALRWKSDGEWQLMTYGELEEGVLNLAAALRCRGIGPGDRVAICLENSWPWIAIDLALQLLGAVTTTIYHTLPAGQVAAILRDANASALISTETQLAALAGTGVAEGLELLQIVVGAGTSGVMLEALLSEGRAARNADQALEKAVRNPDIQADELSAIIYTSGTTGEPKGVMLTHRNVLVNADIAIAGFLSDSDHTVFLHLPLSHVASRNTTIPPTLFTGGTIALAEPEREQLSANLPEVAPTCFITVPYLLDKIMLRVQATLAGKGPMTRYIVRFALRVVRAWRLTGVGEGGPVCSVRSGLVGPLLDLLVVRKIRRRLGGRLRFIAIGAARSNRDSIEFFWGLGIPVYEAYGMTEVTNLASFTWEGDMKLGTVGRAAPGVEISLAADGEILIRGLNVMKGYWNRPQATREAIDADGWYHSGDIGAIDAGGYLRIVDRKKEIFALSTGKKVAPQVVENALKRSPCVANACAVGDGHRYVTALIIPDAQITQQRLALASPLAMDDSRLQDLIRNEVQQVMADLADFERVKRFILIAEPFSPENDLLTPTQKLRRNQIGERYAGHIRALYDDLPGQTVVAV